MRLPVAMTTISSHIGASDLQLSSGVGWHVSRQLRRRNATSTASTSHVNAVGSGLESPPTYIHHFRKSPPGALPPPAPGRLADVARSTSGLSSSARVQSLAIVVVISAIFVFVTLTTTAVVAVLCCKRNSVFVLNQRVHRKSEQTSGSGSDIEQCEMQELERGQRDDDDDDDELQNYEEYNDDPLPVGYFDNNSDSCCGSGNDDLVEVAEVSEFTKNDRSSKHRRKSDRRLASKMSKSKTRTVADSRSSMRPQSSLNRSASVTCSINRCASLTLSTNNGSRTNLIPEAENRHTASGSLASCNGSSGNASVFAIDCDRQRWTPDEVSFPVATDEVSSAADDMPETPTEDRRNRTKRKRNATKSRSTNGRYSYRQLGTGSSDDDHDNNNGVVGY